MVSEGMKRAIKMFFQQGRIATKKKVEENRANMNQLEAMLQIPKDVKIEKVDIKGVPAISICTPDVVEENVVLYLHGSGYVMDSINTHKEFGSRISRVSNL